MAIFNIVLKRIRKNKFKSICIILSIVLTSVLFSTFFTAIVGVNGAAKYSKIKQSGSMNQVEINNCDNKTETAINQLQKNKSVKSVGYREYLADVIDDRLAYSVEFSYQDKTYSECNFQNLITGHMPKSKNEIVMDEDTLTDLGFDKKTGEKINLTLQIENKQVKETFRLVGWFASNRATETKTGFVIASKQYLKAWESKYKKNSVYGQVSLSLLLKSDKDIDKQVKTVLSQAGLDYNNINYSINPSYESGSTGLDWDNIIAFIFILVLISITGYLIIYNIFHISAINDTKFYGLLKVIGMSKKQIGTMVREEATMLLMISVPIGVLVGVIIGEKLLPGILAQTELENIPTELLLNNSGLWIIIAFSVGFSVLTTFISVLGPIRMLKKLSAIEALKFNVSEHMNRKRKNVDGSKLYKFSFYNINRNKKNTVMLICSIALTMIIVIFAFSIFESFDMNKYVSGFTYSDYQIATKQFFKSNYLTDNGNNASLPVNIVKDIESSGIVKNGGKVYGSSDNYDVSIENTGMKRSEYYLDLYGMDPFGIRKDMIIEKKADLTAFYAGKGLLEGAWTDTNGNTTNANYDVGDKVVFKGKNGKTKSYEVIGHVNLGGSAVMNSSIDGGETNYDLYVSVDSYKELVNNP